MYIYIYHLYYCCCKVAACRMDKFLLILFWVGKLNLTEQEGQTVVRTNSFCFPCRHTTTNMGYKLGSSHRHTEGLMPSTSWTLFFSLSQETIQECKLGEKDLIIGHL